MENMNRFSFNFSIHKISVFWVLLLISSNAQSFEIVESTLDTNSNDTIQEEETVLLKCVGSDWYEFCSWTHEDRICKFEWKRNYGEVKKQDCDTEFNARIRFLGNYNSHECTIELSNLSLSDAGEWTCELQAYVWGPISGNTDKASLHLIIDGELDYNQTLIDLPKKSDEEKGKKIRS